jgi:branched-chain amino acid transport system permease protein
MLAQNLLNGLMSGWIYILVALGLTLVLSIVGIVQLAHGEMYMVGSYIVYYFCVIAGLNFFLALPISVLLVGLLGIILERFFLRPFRGNVEGAIISTIALILILQNGIVAIFGESYKDIPSPIQGVLTVLGVRLSWERLITILVSIALVSALLIFINRTKIGQAMVAVSEDRDAAALQGINVNRVSSVAMFFGCALAAAAGALVGAIFDLTPFMGGFALMKGIAVIILGGLGSIPGAIIGGLILGLIDGLVTPLLSVQMAGIIGLAVIILILIFRPQGLLGHE